MTPNALLTIADAYKRSAEYDESFRSAFLNEAAVIEARVRGWPYSPVYF